MDNKAEFWKAHIQGWRDSGLTQPAYCLEHGLALRRLRYWCCVRPPRRAPVSVPAAPALVPVVVADAPTTDARIEVRLPNGLQVRLPLDLEPTRWLPAMRALYAC